MEWAERHLDPRQWAAWKEYEEPGRDVDDGPFWLGLHVPKKATVDAIDLDAKRYILGYHRRREDAPVRPLVVPDLEHFRTLKAIHDAFPARIWCISSATLGVHAWRKRRRPADTESTHAEVKARLGEIGLGHVEVHPMRGRCLRRPFGTDYKTITPEGVLDDWVEQVEYFEHDGRTPPFERVVRAIVAEVRRQVVEYRVSRHQEHRRPRREIDELIDRRSREIVGWFRAGCPDRVVEPEPDQEADKIILPLHLGHPAHDSTGTPSATRPVHGAWMGRLRDGKWASGLLNIARDGLPEPDCVGPVLVELAKWLYWIELFEMPESARKGEVRRLLATFILAKHNGHVTRLLDGDEADVMRQLDRCIESAIRLDPQERSASLELFCRIRQRRSRGQYGHVIHIAPELEGRPAHDSSPSFSPSTYMCIIKDDPLPDELEARLATIAERNDHRKRDGEYPFVRFARRFLHSLWDNRGKARLNRETVLEMLGGKNPNQQVEYKKLLADHGLIEPNWERTIRRGESSARYELARTARTAFEASYQRAVRKAL